MPDRREEIVKKVFADYKKANPRENWLSFDEVKSIGTASIVYACMDEYMKECCLELLDYVSKKISKIDHNGNFIGYRGEVLSKEQLFENFL